MSKHSLFPSLRSRGCSLREGRAKRCLTSLQSVAVVILKGSLVNRSTYCTQYLVHRDRIILCVAVSSGRA